jgi:RNA-directed DNA polymerase
MCEEWMAEVVGRENVQVAWLAVKRNAGAPGIDPMTTEPLRDHIRAHWETLSARLLAGTCVPSPARRMEIPKPNGEGVFTENGLHWTGGYDKIRLKISANPLIREVFS